MQVSATTQPVGPAQLAPAATAASATRSEAAARTEPGPGLSADIAPLAATLLEPASFGSLLAGQEAARAEDAFAAVLGNGPGDWSYDTLVRQLGNAYGADTAPAGGTLSTSA